MMQQTNSQTSDNAVQERLNVLPAELTDLVTLGFLDDVIAEIAEQLNLSEQQKQLLENEVLLVILLFLPRTGFAQRVQESLEVRESAAEKISDYVNAELFNLADEILRQAEAVLTGVVQNMQNTAADIETTPTTLEASSESTDQYSTVAANEEENTVQQPTHAEEQTPPEPQQQPKEVVAPLRTMQGDAERIHGYGAYRSRMKEKYGAPSQSPEDAKKNLADIPKYTDDNT